jgi:hypothetical protein
VACRSISASASAFGRHPDESLPGAARRHRVLLIPGRLAVIADERGPHGRGHGPEGSLSAVPFHWAEPASHSV